MTRSKYPPSGPRLTEERHCWLLAMLVYLGSRAMLTLKRKRGGRVAYNARRDSVLSEASGRAGSTLLRLFDCRGDPVPDLDSVQKRLIAATLCKHSQIEYVVITSWPSELADD